MGVDFIIFSLILFNTVLAESDFYNAEWIHNDSINIQATLAGAWYVILILLISCLVHPYGKLV